MTKKEIKMELKRIKENEKFEVMETAEVYDETYYSYYLGSFLSLDPCGKYHHILSENGITQKCERFWDNLESACSELDMWTESGEGDALDVFLCYAD